MTVVPDSGGVGSGDTLLSHSGPFTGPKEPNTVSWLLAAVLGLVLLASMETNSTLGPGF